MLKLIIVRHGETHENKAKIMQGQSRGTLSETGKKQIAALAERLKDEKIDLILSSDLERTVGTTKVIAAHHSCPVQYMKELRERAFGSLEGLSYTEYQAARDNSSVRPECYRPPGGETMLELFARAESVLTQIKQIKSATTVLVVSHGGTIRCLICKLTGKPVHDAWAIEQENCCVNIFTISSVGVASQDLFNCTRHLVDLT